MSVRRVATNHVAIVLDRSSSMQNIKSATIEAFNQVVETLRAKARKSRQWTTVTLVTFGDEANVEFFNRELNSGSLVNLSQNSYQPYGWTALRDGVGLAVNLLKQIPVPRGGRHDTSYLVIVITDGYENRSKKFSVTEIKTLLRETQGTDRWTYAFQVPPGHRSVAESLGVPPDNITEWEATDQGTRDVSVMTCSSIGNYFADRSAGRGSTRSFYTDLSGLTKRDIKASLDDLAGNFSIYTVPGECSIKGFVELKTGRSYEPGSAYYQLTKTEKIQPQKDVLIMEKGKKSVWGGSEARDLLGLGSSDNIRVVPGNHSNYDIFVQSTSVNRKLVRGTKVVVKKR